MTIRLAISADIPAILSLEQLCESAAHWSEEQYRHALHSSAELPQRLVLVVADSLCADASSAAHLSGFLVARQFASEWELENIAVHPATRRQGVGSNLVHELVALAKSANSQAIHLEVRESNAPARQFYENAGLTVSGRRKLYYTNPAEDAILYRYDLI